MNKKSILRIALISACMLAIPFFGNTYVDGWNWGLGDFAFAFAFFCVTGLALQFAQTKLTSRSLRIAASIAILLAMISIWVMLATG